LQIAVKIKKGLILLSTTERTKYKNVEAQTIEICDYICPRTDFLRISAKFTDTDRLRIFRLLISTDTDRDTDIQLRIQHGYHGLQLMNSTNEIIVKR
jgi:hypothetical protein